MNPAKHPPLTTSSTRPAARSSQGFVDSHSHLVFAGDRTQEFNARMSGQPYRAGGIRTTVAATRAATDEELSASVARYLAEALRQGTTTFETKSGYGLTIEDEARALRIAGRHTDEVTYLGAHIVSPTTPTTRRIRRPGHRPDAGGLRPARPLDRRVLRAGRLRRRPGPRHPHRGPRQGLQPRIHANQLSYGPGVQLAVELGAASADHCTHLTDADVDALGQGSTVATLLPGAEFSTRATWPDARRLLDAGATVALSTDCNPGSSFTSSMPFCVALAVRDMGMTPDEAIWSATAGGAAALRRTDIGRITPGARADLVLLDAPSHVHLAYRPGVPLVSAVWRSGQRVV